MTNSCSHCAFDNPPVADHCGQCLHSLMQKHVPSARKKDDAFKDALLKEPISELLTGLDLLVCSPNDSLEKIVKIFQKDKKGCILVYKNKKMVGILSNRDLLLRTTGTKIDLSKIKVAEIMTRDPSFLHPEDPIAFAINKMAMGGYRHIPILRPDGTPVSILLIRDVLRYLSASKKNY
jgi:CBS domain-containing protein